jgi:hypothetical protein
MVCEEFTNQVRVEKELNLPFAPHMDNLNSTKAVAKLQIGFIDYVVSPLWSTVVETLPKMRSCMDYIRINREKWVLES